MQITRAPSTDSSLSQVTRHCPCCNYASCLSSLGAGLKLLLTTDADPQPPPRRHQERRGLCPTLMAPEASGLPFQQSRAFIPKRELFPGSSSATRAEMEMARNENHRITEW